MPQNLSWVSVFCLVDRTNLADDMLSNLHQMLGSGSVPNLGPPNQSYGSGFTTQQEQLLIPIQESIESTPALNEAHAH